MADYYVAIGGNNSDDGSAAHPWATIQKGADVAVAGDTVHVAPGTYGAVTSSTSGTATSRITFVSDTKWGASINVVSGAATLWQNSGNYVTIQGFDLTSNVSTNAGATVGINNDASNCWIIGNRVHDMPMTNSWPPDHPNFSNGGGGICSGTYLEWSMDPSTSSSGNRIIGNLVYNMGQPSPNQDGSLHCLYSRDAYGFYQNNIAYNASGYGLTAWHGATNNTYCNNLIWGCRNGGIGIGNNTGYLCDYNVVNNNIIIYNPGVSGVPPWISGINNVNNNGANSVYYNNLCNNNQDGNINIGSGHGYVRGTLTSDAQFVNWQFDGTGDYHIKTTSPCVGSGIYMGAPSTDYDGNPRPSRLGYVDIGPFQLQMNVNPRFSLISYMHSTFMKRRI